MTNGHARNSKRRRARGAALLWTLAACGAAPDTTARNVLLVTLDTTRADALGAYGATIARTPTMDRLAQEGFLFELAISSSAVTPVSHASMLTGLYPYNHGLRVLSAESGFRLPESAATLPRILKQHGWNTLAVHSAFPVSSYFGFDGGFDVFESLESRMLHGAKKHRWDVREHQRRSDASVDLALELLDTAREPFFLWLHLWDPHDTNLLPPDSFRAAFGAREEWTKDSRERYEAEVSYLDGELGRLLDSLAERGVRARTLVVVVADHGEGFGEHDWQNHRILYQEQVQVPLIVHVPWIAGGRRIEELVRTVDIAPTVLDYLGLDVGPSYDGRSLRALMEGHGDAPRLAYADQINGYDLNAVGMLERRAFEDFVYCAMDARWKLIYRPNHPERHELFDLANDPEEATNLYAQRPAERDRLLRELAHRRGWVTAPFAPGADADGEEAARARDALAQLGYAAGEDGEDGAPLSDPRWAWSCVEHGGVLTDAAAECPSCDEPLLLIRRP